MSAFAVIVGSLAGAALLAVVVLILAFLIIGLMSPFGALVASLRGARNSSARNARTARPHVGRPVLHH